jgi:serine/threonine protein phosphatase 1
VFPRHWFQSKKPSVGAGRRVFAVGDIHGRRDLLEFLVGQIATHGSAPAKMDNNVLVFLGDYIDRGPDSCGVIEQLMGLQERLPGWSLVFLRGNHDQTVLDFLQDPGLYRVWRHYGAPQTLLSYGVMPPRFDDMHDFERARDEFAGKCPPSHIEFIAQMPLHHSEGDYLFVHAGVRPGIPLDKQSPEDLMQIREDFLFSRRRFDKIVVHGHTPGDEPVELSNRIGIDTGAHATGVLTALVLEGESRSFLSTGPRKNLGAGSIRLEAVNG